MITFRDLCPPHNKDCAYYDEDHDMGKTIPLCKLLHYGQRFDCRSCAAYQIKSNIDAVTYEDMGKTLPIDKGGWLSE